MKLNDLDLSPDEVHGLRHLLASGTAAPLHAQEAHTEAEQDALAQRRAAQLTDIAIQYATQHGALEWMVTRTRRRRLQSWCDAARLY